MLKGRCNCGEVEFSLGEAATNIIVCHCSICRRATGAAGIPIVVGKNEHFRWVRGLEHVATWTKPVGDWTNNFCRRCGSPLPRTNDEHTMAIPAGLFFEGHEGLRVEHRIFVASKASWDETPVATNCVLHPGAYGTGVG